MASKIKRFMPLAEAFNLLKSNGYSVWCYDPDAKYFEADKHGSENVCVYFGGSGSDLYVLKAF